MIEYVSPFEKDPSVVLQFDKSIGDEGYLGAIETHGALILTAGKGFEFKGIHGQPTTLDSREMRILGGMSVGMTETQMKQKLNVSGYYALKLYAKLGVNSPGAALAVAFDKELLLTHVPPDIQRSEVSPLFIPIAAQLEQGTALGEIATDLNISHMNQVTSLIRRDNYLHATHTMVTIARAANWLMGLTPQPAVSLNGHGAPRA